MNIQLEALEIWEDVRYVGVASLPGRRGKWVWRWKREESRFKPELPSATWIILKFEIHARRIVGLPSQTFLMLGLGSSSWRPVIETRMACGSEAARP